MNKVERSAFDPVIAFFAGAVLNLVIIYQKISRAFENVAKWFSKENPKPEPLMGRVQPIQLQPFVLEEPQVDQVKVEENDANHSPSLLRMVGDVMISNPVINQTFKVAATAVAALAVNVFYNYMCNNAG